MATRCVLQVDCVSCGSGLTFDENKRIIVVAETSDEKQKKQAEVAAKKAATTAKRAPKVGGLREQLHELTLSDSIMLSDGFQLKHVVHVSPLPA